jgi:serine/threonine-protein kinase
MDEPTVAEGGDAASSRPLRFGDRYRSLARLGSGGMGSVYLAGDEELGELVALEVLREDLLGDPAMLERFRDEVRLARRVSSPLVARTHDRGSHLRRSIDLFDEALAPLAEVERCLATTGSP